MDYTKFNSSFFTLVLGGLVVSGLLAFLRFGGQDNDLILRYQIAKMDRLVESREQLDFAVLGDSSAGNGVAADELRKLSGLSTENFALTGSFGLAGSLHFMKRLHEQHGVQRFVLIHSADIWSRSLQKEAIFKLLPITSLDEYSGLVGGSGHWEFAKYLLNPQRLVEVAKYFYLAVDMFLKNATSHIRIEADFLAQRETTFANGKMRIDIPMQWKPLSQHKLQELRLVRGYCMEKNLKCLLMSGPVHESAYAALQQQMDMAFRPLSLDTENFRIDYSVKAFPSTWMGDTVDHVDLKRRPETSNVYWVHILNWLGF